MSNRIRRASGIERMQEVVGHFISPLTLFFFVCVHANAKEIHAHVDAVCYSLTLCSVSTCLMYTCTAQTSVRWPPSDRFTPCSVTAGCHYVAPRSPKEDDRAGMWMGRMCTWYHVVFRRALPPINQPGADSALTWISHWFKTQNIFGHFILSSIILSLVSIWCQ